MKFIMKFNASSHLFYHGDFAAVSNQGIEVLAVTETSAKRLNANSALRVVRELLKRQIPNQR